MSYAELIWRDRCLAAEAEVERLREQLDALEDVGPPPAAVQFKALLQEGERLRAALSGLLDDTQHAHHADCEEGPCPVREARAALAKEEK